MKNLNWAQAHKVARRGRPIRRETWRKWLTFEGLWCITQPLIETITTDPGQDERRAVAQNFDFAAQEFYGRDWTDEPWNGGVRPPDLPPADPMPPTGDPDIPWPVDDPLRPPGTPTPGTDGPATPDTTGGGSGGTGGAGSGSGGGSGVGGGIIIIDDIWGDGGSGGLPPAPNPPVKPPLPKPHVPPATPVVTVSIFATPPVMTGEQSEMTCTVYVTVTISGGPTGVGLISVDCPVGTPVESPMGTAHDGFSHTYVYTEVPFVTGGTITVTATYGAPPQPGGTDYIGTATYTFP